MQGHSPVLPEDLSGVWDEWSVSTGPNRTMDEAPSTHRRHRSPPHRTGPRQHATETITGDQLDRAAVQEHLFLALAGEVGGGDEDAVLAALESSGEAGDGSLDRGSSRWGRLQLLSPSSGPE